MKPTILLAATTSLATAAPYFVLTGDSTTAVNGGWGDGFLSFLQGGAAGWNTAKSGATTASFRAQGLWDGAVRRVREKVGEYKPVFVTIQFGHNDQKEAAGISLDQFQRNLEDMVREVAGAGGVPSPSQKSTILTPKDDYYQILITSLTRRTFSGGSVVRNLENERQRTIAAAAAAGAQYLDLNAKSTDYINAVGDADGRRYDLAQGDRTHLNKAAEVVFGRMVADLLLEKKGELRAFLRDNSTISDAIRDGRFVI
ncbi:acetylesterase [Pyricularia oryzae Y34]|uniref:Acetylesterase n=2 Tax=Pyricularia oryzae TaxID=318829 RepID=A0AA97P6K8_PYRO3|nr:acetylesterase [Pyricularia oryzae Y34]